MQNPVEPGGLRATIAALTLGLSICGGAATASTCTTLPNAAAEMADVGAMLNAVRGAKSRVPLARNAALDAAAQAHACDVAANGVTGIKGSDGSTPKSRVIARGYKPCLTQQIQAVGPAYGGDAMALWFGNKQGGRATILNRLVKSYGLGIAMAGQRPVWVLIVGRSCSS